MPYTKHGHWFGAGEPTEPKPDLRARCGGPGMCLKCREEIRSVTLGETVFLLITVKLPKTVAHDPHNKVTGTCPLSGQRCTDVTGEHHTVLVRGGDVEAAKLAWRKFHITRIERVAL